MHGLCDILSSAQKVVKWLLHMAAEPEKMLRYFTSIIDNSEDILSHHNAQVYGVDSLQNLQDGAREGVIEIAWRNVQVILRVCEGRMSITSRDSENEGYYTQFWGSS